MLEVAFEVLGTTLLENGQKSNPADEKNLGRIVRGPIRRSLRSCSKNIAFVRFAIATGIVESPAVSKTTTAKPPTAPLPEHEYVYAASAFVPISASLDLAAESLVRLSALSFQHASLF